MYRHRLVLFCTRFLKIIGVVFSLVFKRDLSGPVRFRIFFEEIGGAFIKFGQMLALRRDFMPHEYVAELLNLLNNFPEIPFEKIEKIFKEDIGGEVSFFFIEFDRRPVACGSIGQVYKAMLPDGSKVAVKIQKPNIKELLEADFMLISMVVGFINFFRLFSVKMLDDVVTDFVSWTRKELDFVIEAQNTQAIFNHSVEHPRTVIPKSYLQFSTKRVLVQEFIEEGVSVNDIFIGKSSSKALKEMNIDVDEMARYLVADEMRQYFIDGFYHADPHPANLFFLPDNRLGYLDFGIVGSASADRILLLRVLKGIADKNIDTVCRNFLEFNIQSLGKELDNALQTDIKHFWKMQKVFDKIKELVVKDLIKDVGEIMSPWFEAIDNPEASLSEKSASTAFFKTLRVIEKYGGDIPREVILLFRALAILDMVALQVSPRFDMIRALRHFFNKYPFKKIEEMVSSGEHENVGEKIISNTEADWEFFMEYAANERERLSITEERLYDLIEYYLELYEELEPVVKKLK